MLKTFYHPRIRELNDNAAAAISGGVGMPRSMYRHPRFRTNRIMLPRVMMFPNMFSEDENDDGIITTEERYSQEIFTEESSSNQETT